MEDKIWAVVHSLQAYKAHPQSETRAIGEYLLPLMLDIAKAVKEFKSELKRENEDRFMEILETHANKKEQFRMDMPNNITYTWLITKNNTK